MTKADLVGEVAKQTGLSKKAVEEAVDAAVEIIKKTVKKDKTFRYPGFGTFNLKERKARTGINPQTKEKIKIGKSKTVGFKPSQSFKEKL